MLSDDDAPPVDRPNLSKDYLAGNAPGGLGPAAAGELLRRERHRPAAQGERHRHRRAVRARSRSPTASTVPYDRLLLATGAEPVRLTIPGADQPHVHTLRSLADCRAIIERAKTARRAVVHRRELHRARGRGRRCAPAALEVHVVAPDKRPMERILGPQMGDFVRALHEEHGVVFHLEDTASAIDGKQVKLKSGGTLEADLVVAGIGVRPRIALAEKAGLADRSRRHRERLSRNERAGDLRRRRHRALARSA